MLNISDKIDSSLVIRQCLTCNEVIPSIKRFNKFCCSSCAATYNHLKGNIQGVDISKDYNLNPKRCLGCQIVLTFSQRHQDYCSKECRKKFKHMIINTEQKCIICGNVFFNKIIRKTCSSNCYTKLRTNISINNPKCGGETHYRKYIYSGVYMDSKWEVDIAKYLDSKNIKWERSRKHMFMWTDTTNIKRRYYPDFYLPEHNIYLDPKNNYKLEKDQYKLQQVQKENNIIIYYGSISNIIININNIIK